MVLSQVPENGVCTLQGTSPSPSRHKSMEFGKFYQTSYLDMNGNVIKKGSLSSPNLRPPVGFHRPGELLIKDIISYQSLLHKLRIFIYLSLLTYLILMSASQ